MPFIVAAVLWSSPNLYAQTTWASDATISPTPIVAPADGADRQVNTPAPPAPETWNTVATTVSTVPTVNWYVLYLGSENPATWCRTVENYSWPNTLLEIKVNWEVLDLVSFKAKDGTSDIVIPKTRTRLWAFGKCFDIFQGQVFPVRISSEGKIVWVNSYGWLLTWFKDPNWVITTWWYNWIKKMIMRINEGKVNSEDWIDTIDAWIDWNVTRLLRLMKEDPMFLSTDSQEAYIATLLQLQLDILSRPGSYSRTYSMWEAEILDFLRKNKFPSFISDDDKDKFWKIHTFVYENLYRKSESGQIVAHN